MANTKVQYIGDGNTDTFTVTFPYIIRDHVKVLVNGTELLSTDYTFLTDSSIQIHDTPGVDDIIDIKRQTEVDTRLVDFQNGAILTEQDMDLDAVQSFYLIQENQENYSDLINDALTAIAVANGIVVSDPEDILNQLVQEMLGSAAATQLQQRITDIDANAEAILNNTTSLVAGDQNLQSQINALADATAATVYVQANEPVPGVGGVPDPIPDGARWYDTDDNNHPYIYDGPGLVWVSILDPRIGVNEADITALDVRMTTAEGNITGNASAISVLDTTVTNLNGTVTAQGADITQLQADVVANDGDILGNVNAISALDVRVTSAEGSITSQASDISALQAAVTANDGDISANGLAISALDTRVTSAEGSITANSSDITGLQTTVSLRARTFATPAASPPTADNTGDLWWDTTNNKLYRWNGTAWALLEDGDITANASAITTLQTDVTVAEGNIATNASDITALETTVNNPTTGVAANASGLSALDVRVTDAEGDITSQGASITSLQSEVDLRSTVFAQTNQPTANNPGDLWIDTDDGNKLWRWNGSAWINVQDAAIAGNASAISALTTSVNTNAGDIVANANSITSLDSRVTTAEGDIASAEVTIAAHTTAIATAEGDIAALEARYGVSLNVNGYVSGFSLNNSGTTSDFVILADKFALVHPSGDAGETEYIPFQIVSGSVEFNANVKVQGNLIVDGTINGAKIGADEIDQSHISVTNLSAINADLGAITAGSITLDSAGWIKTTGVTNYSTGAGVWIGYDATAYKFRVGNMTDNFISWDGTELKVRGNTSIGNYTASTTVVLLAANTNRTTSTETQWEEKKKFKINKPGTIRVYFTGRLTSTAGGLITSGEIRVKKDGVVQGTHEFFSNTTASTRSKLVTTTETTDYITIECKAGSRNAGEPLAAHVEISMAEIRADVDLGESVITD